MSNAIPGTESAASGRSDVQKACRKLIITTGIRVGRQASVVAFLGVGAAAAGAVVGGSLRIAGLAIAAALLLVSVPMLATGRKLSGRGGRLLAAIDDPGRVATIHIDATPRGQRYTFAVRDGDGNVDQILLLASEIEQLKSYFQAALPDLMIASSERAAKTIHQVAA
jgi:hypothetical protein